MYKASAQPTFKDNKPDSDYSVGTTMNYVTRQDLVSTINSLLSAIDEDACIASVHFEVRIENK